MPSSGMYKILHPAPLSLLVIFPYALSPLVSHSFPPPPLPGNYCTVPNCNFSSRAWDFRNKHRLLAVLLIFHFTRHHGVLLFVFNVVEPLAKSFNYRHIL